MIRCFMLVLGYRLVRYAVHGEGDDRTVAGHQQPARRIDLEKLVKNTGKSDCANERAAKQQPVKRKQKLTP